MLPWFLGKKKRKTLNYRLKPDEDDTWVDVQPEDAEDDGGTIVYWGSDAGGLEKKEKRFERKKKVKKERQSRRTESEDWSTESQQSSSPNPDRHLGACDGYVMVDFRQDLQRGPDPEIDDWESRDVPAQETVKARGQEEKSITERADPNKTFRLPPTPLETEGAPFEPPPRRPTPGPLDFPGLDSSYWTVSNKVELERLHDLYLHSKIEDSERFTADQRLRHDKDLGWRHTARQTRVPDFSEASPSADFRRGRRSERAKVTYQYQPYQSENLDRIRWRERVPVPEQRQEQGLRQRPITNFFQRRSAWDDLDGVPSVRETLKAEPTKRFPGSMPNSSILPERLHPLDCAEPEPVVYCDGTAEPQSFVQQRLAEIAVTGPSKDRHAPSLLEEISLCR